MTAPCGLTELREGGTAVSVFGRADVIVPRVCERRLERPSCARGFPWTTGLVVDQPGPAHRTRDALNKRHRPLRARSRRLDFSPRSPEARR